MIAMFRLLAAAAMMIATTGGGSGQSAVPSPVTTLGSPAQADLLERFARKNGDRLIPTCRFEGARCGFIDRDGKTVIAPEWDWVDRFADDRALVVQAGRYGAIDATGRLVIAPVYDALTSFDDGLAQVLVGDRLGVIDKDGHWVVPAEHGLIVRISDDVFLVAEPPYPKAARLLRPLGDRFSRALSYVDGKRWGIVGRGGAWIVRPTFARVMAFSNELDGPFWGKGLRREEWAVEINARGRPIDVGARTVTPSHAEAHDMADRCIARFQVFVLALDKLLSNPSRTFLDAQVLLAEYFPVEGCDIHAAMGIARQSRFFSKFEEQSTYFNIIFDREGVSDPPCGIRVQISLLKASGNSFLSAAYPNQCD